MAQYYNLVTGGNVPIMVEDVQQMCEGQSIQLVVEDMNNCTNGGQQFLTYTAAPQRHDGGLFSQQTILGSQLTGTPIDQRQNVYIINTTNDLPVQQSGHKTDVVHASLANDGLVNIVDERGNQYVISGTNLPANNVHEVQQQSQQQQQIQWINMPENNINFEDKSSTSTVKVATGVRTPQQKTLSSITVQTQGQCASVSSQFPSPGPSDKKTTPRLYRNKGRGGVTGGGPPLHSPVNVDSSRTPKTVATSIRVKNFPKTPQLPHQGSPSSLSNESTQSNDRSIPTNNNRSSNVTSNNLGLAYRGKNFPGSGQNVTMQNVNSRQLTTQGLTRATILSKTPENIGQLRNSTIGIGKSGVPPLHYPGMDSLSERIKQAKLQKVMTQVSVNQTTNSPATPTARPPLHYEQRRQQNVQMQRATTTTSNSSTLANPPRAISINQNLTSEKTNPNTGQQQILQNQSQHQQRRQQVNTQQESFVGDFRNSIDALRKPSDFLGQQKYQRDNVPESMAITTTTTTTTMTMTIPMTPPPSATPTTPTSSTTPMTPMSPTSSTTTTTPSVTKSLSIFSENDDRMEIDSITSDCTVESDSTNNHEPQQESTNEESDNASASFAYLQKVIENPQNTIVQNQIAGNTVKMLVVLQNGEQRLITFDIPNEPCTVQDLLEQANISFGEETCVSLVSDRILGINYIVEGGAHMGANCPENNESGGESGQYQDNTIATPDSSSPNFTVADENSNSSITPNEEPKFVDGKLAVCPNCGIGSLDFNRCSRCKKPLPENVKTILMAPDTQAKKETLISIDTFYKKTQEQNASSKLEAAMNKKRTGRGGRRLPAKTRPVKEPVCLTISSDEEEGSEKPRKTDSKTSSVSSSTCAGSIMTNDEPDTILEKEPIITNSSSSSSQDSTVDSEGGVKGGGREDDNHEDGLQKPQTSLICRTVRIGSYKYVPRERIVISQSGVRFAVPLLEDDKSFVTLDVKFREIVKVLIHFGKMMPVLFFYTSPIAGAMIREVLGMQDPKGPYYDPAGKDHTHKRITLLPELLSEEAKIILKGLFVPHDLLVELNPKEANDILVRASPKDVIQNMQSQALAGRRQSQTPGTTNANVNGGGIQIMTVYPPPPAKGGIAINTEDYICLGEDQFLNDAIIDFYLRYLTLEVLSESDHNRTHVFSSYFYKRLTSPHAQAGECPVPLTAAARRHARVQKWTKNVNIFEKDFIIIPINEHAHWFLAIICYPGLVGKVALPSKTPKDGNAHKTGSKTTKTKDGKVQALTIGSTTITPVTTTITIDQADEGSERDEAEGDDDEMEMDSDDDEETENNEEKASSQLGSTSADGDQEEMVKMPCILIFDSLAGASRSRVVATLRDYLSCEHVAKVGKEKIFSKDTIKGSSPKVPQQSNFTDCGLYLLHYVESFFKAPIKNYVLPIKTLKNWFEEIVVTRKREDLAKLLVKLMNQTKGDKTISLPIVQFPTYEGKLRPKPETAPELKVTKIEGDPKKKISQTTAGTQQTTTSADDKTRLVAVSTSSVLTTTENSGEKAEVVTRTVYQIVPCASSPSSSSPALSLDSSHETLFDAKPTSISRTPGGTLSYLRNKRIPRLMTRDHESQENQGTSAKKHKGEDDTLTRNITGNKSTSGSQIVAPTKAVTATNYDSCK